MENAYLICYIMMVAILVMFGVARVILWWHDKLYGESLDHWTQVHNRNQEKVKRDQVEQFAALLVKPDLYRPKRSRGINHVEN